jgi:hypothetical protein
VSCHGMRSEVIRSTRYGHFLCFFFQFLLQSFSVSTRFRIYSLLVSCHVVTRNTDLRTSSGLFQFYSDFCP